MLPPYVKQKLKLAQLRGTKMNVLHGISTIIAMAFFFGIVWWAWSKYRVKDNEEAANLPFSLPDEEDLEHKNENKGVKS